MNKSECDKYWTEFIQTCRVSGLSDYEQCRINHIATSFFYYNVKRLRMAACNNVAAVVPVHEKQEVVPIHYNELKDNNSTIPKCYDDKSDIKVDFNGCVTWMKLKILPCRSSYGVWKDFR